MLDLIANMSMNRARTNYESSKIFISADDFNFSYLEKRNVRADSVLKNAILSSIERPEGAHQLPLLPIEFTLH